MSATGNSGGGSRHQGLTQALPDSSLALLVRLDREIEDLRQSAPPGLENTINGLSETMLEIHEALGLPTFAPRR